MNRLTINDLDFCQSELPDLEQVQGSGTLNNVAWKGAFAFGFSHNRISSFSVGAVTAFAIAIGPLVVYSSPE